MFSEIRHAILPLALRYLKRRGDLRASLQRGHSCRMYSSISRPFNAAICSRVALEKSIIPLPSSCPYQKLHPRWRKRQDQLGCVTMIAFLSLLVHVLVSPFKTRARLEAEIILLRHQ